MNHLFKKSNGIEQIIEIIDDAKPCGLLGIISALLLTGALERAGEHAHQDRQRSAGFEAGRRPAATDHRSAEEANRTLEKEIGSIHSSTSLGHQQLILCSVNPDKRSFCLFFFFLFGDFFTCGPRAKFERS